MVHIALAMLAVLLTACSHLLFKTGSKTNARGGLLSVYLNRFAVSAYLLLFLVTFLNLFAYGKLDMRYALLIQPFTFVLICVFSMVFLRERMTPRQVLGAGIIVLGVLVYNL
jgi:drug/metabolite transporter (DMT)-like permease